MRHNPAEHSVPPKPRAAEHTCWTPDEAAAFLHHSKGHHADRLTDLFEAMLGTGMRCGEAPTLHWSDVHLMDRTLFVRWTLATINLCGHLFKDSADQAVHALAQALDRAQAGRIQPHFSREDDGENPVPVAA
ncbi:tyrosine-type recombinase/integrase [Kitasatospora cineracea]|uniref:tyrosine-type recombinase/integrase n=1 Tax=Kitasatospora cineracea TaxID=88074 RepID=UPI000F4ECA14|nr:tyrosine-type recombinase/integrase [Kitasatospora cineracea]